jgi:hypothetical protein
MPSLTKRAQALASMLVTHATQGQVRSAMRGARRVIAARGRDDDRSASDILASHPYKDRAFHSAWGYIADSVPQRDPDHAVAKALLELVPSQADMLDAIAARQASEINDDPEDVAEQAQAARQAPARQAPARQASARQARPYPASPEAPASAVADVSEQDRWIASAGEPAERGAVRRRGTHKATGRQYLVIELEPRA